MEAFMEKMKVGDRFGKLVVIEKAQSKPRSPKYKVQCDCGNTSEVYGVALRQGKTVSCGCHRKSIIAEYSESKRLGYGIAAAKHVYDGYKRNAIKRGYCFELFFEDFLLITKSNCVYCGAEPNQVEDRKYNAYGTYTYNGIDRVDNTKGYTLDNVAPCCGICNIMKRAMSEDGFLTHIKRIHDFRKLGGN